MLQFPPSAPRLCCSPHPARCSARKPRGVSRSSIASYCICGRYEGVDERVAEHLATDEISIGDFVLSGGELAAAMILDAVTRLIPGALGNEDSIVNESFSEPAKQWFESSLGADARLRRTSRFEPVAGFSIIRITRGRLRSEVGTFRRFCSAETTKRFASGARKKHWKKLGGTDQTCCNLEVCKWLKARLRLRRHVVRPARQLNTKINDLTLRNCAIIGDCALLAGPT